MKEKSEYKRDSYFINGLTISDVNSLDRFIEETLSYNDSLLHIITFNTDFLRLFHKDKEFNAICQKSGLIVADGIGVVILILIKYGKLIKRITGTELFETCFSIANQNRLKVALVGSTETTLLKLSNIVNEKWTEVELLIISPESLFETNLATNSTVLAKLISFKPDFLFVALGCPRQEKWISRHIESIGAKINIGVGAVFDFYSGYKRRAPSIFQKFGIEWIWRIWTEPLRLGKRYLLLDLPFYLTILIKHLFTRNKI